MSAQKPSIGLTVHFVQNSVHYAAVIVKVWTETCVNVLVLPNGSDKITLGAVDAQSIAHSVNLKQPTAMFGRRANDLEWSWHWPEQV